MDQNLRGLFERALDDEPVPPPGDLAGAAMAQGARLRRRRHLIGGAATALSVAVAAAGALALAEPPAPAPTAAATCVTGGPASEVAVFLDPDATDPERVALGAALGRDPRVAHYRYETSEQAFERFEVLWRDDPGMVASTDADSLPASFRVELADPDAYAAFRAEVDRLDGVAEIVGRACR